MLLALWPSFIIHLNPIIPSEILMVQPMYIPVRKIPLRKPLEVEKHRDDDDLFIINLM